MIFKNPIIQELKTQNLLKDERIKELEEYQEKLLDRLMSRDYSEYSASQLKTEDDLDSLQDDETEELDPNNPPKTWQSPQRQIKSS